MTQHLKLPLKSNEEALKSLLTHFLPLPKDSVIVGIKILDPDLLLINLLL